MQLSVTLISSSQDTLIPPEGHCQNNKQLGFFKESYLFWTGERCVNACGCMSECVQVHLFASIQTTIQALFLQNCRAASSICTAQCVEVVPPRSCLGQIPLAGVSLLSSFSSPPGVTWMPTSTGMDPLPSSSDLALGEMGMPMIPPASPGLEKDPGPPPSPLHRRRLCSMKTRISPRGKLVWHWPQVNRSCSPGPTLLGLGVDGSGDGDPAPES